MTLQSSLPTRVLTLPHWLRMLALPLPTLVLLLPVPLPRQVR